MKNLITILIAFFFAANCSNAQIKNSKTEIIQVWGNCNMCKQTIEKAANKKGIANAVWDKDSKMATINFDTTKTSLNEILKRIALAGYDNKIFTAPDEAYNNLPGCCQYERPEKNIVKENAVTTPQATAENSNGLQSLYDAYFDLKDALVKSDLKIATQKAELLLNAINKVKMETLGSNHALYMNKESDLKVLTQKIIESKDLEIQRQNFASLSTNIYELIKVTKLNTPVYYQHCPMYNDGKGANWLSKESNIKNPYYGSMMLSCGSVLETIKQ